MAKNSTTITSNTMVVNNSTCDVSLPWLATQAALHVRDEVQRARDEDHLVRVRQVVGAAQRLPPGELEPGGPRHGLAVPHRGHEAQPGWLARAGKRRRCCCSRPSCCW